MAGGLGAAILKDGTHSFEVAFKVDFSLSFDLSLFAAAPAFLAGAAAPAAATGEGDFFKLRLLKARSDLLVSSRDWAGFFCLFLNV